MQVSGEQHLAGSQYGTALLYRDQGAACHCIAEAGNAKVVGGCNPFLSSIHNITPVDRHVM